MDYRITQTDADTNRTADAVVENSSGAWLAEWNVQTQSADILTDEDGDYIPAPHNWRDLVIA